MNLLFLTLAFPLLGFLILTCSNGQWSERATALVGVGSIGLAAAVSAWIVWQFQSTMLPGAAYTQHLWNWLSVAEFTPGITLYLDGLSLTLLGVVTGVGFLIHLFASWYMRGEEGYARFFAYTNLFIFSMLLLVLSDNLLLLYFGWEGVGLCSYLLIGFYFKSRVNGNAALKAFLVTRIGDVFLAIGLFVLFATLGTLNIQELILLAPAKFQAGDPWLSLATLLLLGGAVGKSAQLPLQTWLADAMAGPTPVSALIHAATMVTAGVYLIARMHGLFLLTPEVLQLVGLVGGCTLLLGGFAALVQTDIKRILAYSTMSQLGYMFLALGVAAWDAAIFHLMTHAFFKALLFLAAGAVIHACRHEQNIFNMGGLWKKLPLVYVSFLVGCAALMALPIVTAGFYSKDEILWETLASGHHILLYMGLWGAWLTAFYSFRLLYFVFHGPAQQEAHPGKGTAYWLPLVVLIVLSTFVGALITPPLSGVLPESIGHAGGEAKHRLEIITVEIVLSGLLLAAFLYRGKRRILQFISTSLVGRILRQYWFAAWGFDWLYKRLFVRPYLYCSRVLARDPLDRLVNLIPHLVWESHQALRATQNGYVRWYAASIGIGAAFILGIIVLG